MKHFYKDKVAEVFYDDAVDCLFLKYVDKVPNDEAFVKINSAVLDAFVTLKTQNFVADIRKMGIISINSQNWVVNNLLPGMFKHLKGKTLYHAQLLDPSEIMAKVSASNIKSKSNKVAEGFEVIQFTNEADLRKHLSDKKKS